ncbi:MAG: CarD family transcriptional regulator, partial [Thioclava sp.]
EVVRDLHRSDDQREQSYSERQLYEAALERLTREVAAVSGTDEERAAKTVDEVLVGRAA